MARRPARRGGTGMLLCSLNGPGVARAAPAWQGGARVDNARGTLPGSRLVVGGAGAVTARNQPCCPKGPALGGKLQSHDQRRERILRTRPQPVRAPVPNRFQARTA
jgi:hypothetical protein